MRASLVEAGAHPAAPLPGALEGRLRWRLPEGERLEAAVTTLDGGAALAAVRVLRPR